MSRISDSTVVKTVRPRNRRIPSEQIHIVSRMHSQLHVTMFTASRLRRDPCGTSQPVGLLLLEVKLLWWYPAVNR